MPHITDTRFDALRVLVPTDPPTTNDMLFAWTLTQGGSGNTLNDRIFSMLVAQGATPGQINDMWFEVLTAIGFAQPALSDKMQAFWLAGGSFSGGPGVSNWQLEGSIDSWATESGGVWLTEAP